jgi:hypothetical protein
MHFQEKAYTAARSPSYVLTERTENRKVPVDLNRTLPTISSIALVQSAARFSQGIS